MNEFNQCQLNHYWVYYTVTVTIIVTVTATVTASHGIITVTVTFTVIFTITVKVTITVTSWSVLQLQSYQLWQNHCHRGSHCHILTRDENWHDINTLLQAGSFSVEFCFGKYRYGLTDSYDTEDEGINRWSNSSWPNSFCNRLSISFIFFISFDSMEKPCPVMRAYESDERTTPMMIVHPILVWVREVWAGHRCTCR